METTEKLVMEVDNIDDDPILAEIPMFIAKDFQEQLYTYNVASRLNESKKSLKFTCGRFRPTHEILQLETMMNPRAIHYSIEEAENIAEEVNHQCDNKSLIFKNNIVDREILTSTRLVENPEHYGVGVYTGMEYHITPLKGRLKMKVDCTYATKLSKLKPKKEEQVGEASNAQKVTVRFAPGISKKGEGENQLFTYKKMIKKFDEEAWVKVNYHHHNSELSKLQQANIYDRTRQPVMELQLTDEDCNKYIKHLIPESLEEEVIKPSLPSDVISFSSLKVLPLLDRCKLLLKDAKIMAFEQLHTLLTGCEGLTNQSLLKALQEIAVLVRGNWIIKSEILFPKDKFSAVNGVPADYMCKARDYVLCMFTKHQYVERSQASGVINVPTDELKEIFMGISKLRYNKRWELNFPIDNDFISRFPDVVAAQAAWWEEREAELEIFFKERCNKEKRQRRKSRSFSEDTSKMGPSNGEITSTTPSKIERKKSPIEAKKRRTVKTISSKTVKNLTKTVEPL